MSQQNKPFPGAWLQRCRSEEERAELKEYLSRCTRLFDELRTILDREEYSIARAESDYETPSWAYKQAHMNGMREMLSRIRTLIP